MAPSPTPKRRSVRAQIAKVIVLGAGAGILTLVLIATALVLLLPPSALAKVPGFAVPPPPAAQAAAQALGYDLVYLPEVSADRVWTFPVNAEAYRANACADDVCTPLARVFADADLTKQLDAALTLTGDGKFKVSGAVADGFADPPCTLDKSGNCQRAAGQDRASQVARQGKWTVGEGYFLVRYFDEDGVRLDRFQVTMFTVRENRLAAPKVQATTVASDGSVTISWTAVPEATSYSVLSVVRGKPAYADGAENGVVTYRVVGQATGTSLNTADVERDFLTKALTDASAPASGAQNLAMGVTGAAIVLTTQDELAAKAGETPDSYQPTENGMPKVSYAVMAVNDLTTSPLTETGATDLLGRTPAALAKQTNARLGRSAGCDGSLTLAQCLERFTMMAVTMSDGRLADRPAQFVVLPGNGKCTPAGAKARTCWQLRAMAYGTTIVAPWRLYVSGNGPSSSDKKAIESRNVSNFDAWKKAGGADASRYVAPRATPVSGVEYTETMPTISPNVPHAVNGSTELTTFLGAHVDLGDTTVKIPKALVPGDAKSVKDQFYEAISQNPLSLMTSVWWSASAGDQYVTLQITVGQDAKDLAAKRTKVADKVKKVVASIIKPGMSDRAKALAINKWLSANATYDKAAYNASKKLGVDYSLEDWEGYMKKHADSSTAVGVLLNGKGVCASYAAAFRALADASGLRSVVVTGTGDGEGHAWNKVFMDGKWQLVDPTWNDGYAEAGGSVTRYFGLRDGADKHRQDNDWMTDVYVSYYAAK